MFHVREDVQSIFSTQGPHPKPHQRKELHLSNERMFKGFHQFIRFEQT